MKNQKTVRALGVAATLTFLVACDSRPVNQNDNASKDTSKATEGSATEIGKAVESAKPAVFKAVTEAKNTATEVASDATAKANLIIGQAKALIGENKYSDALSTLGGLSNLKLTPDQEKIVAGLKEQIQKAMSSDGAKAVGNLLKQ